MAVNEKEYRPPVSGVKAVYRDPGLECYQGNPLIEALPPIYTEAQVARLLQYAPLYKTSYREMPLEHRLHLILDAVRFIQPLAIHLRLEQCLSRMIRGSYVGRNPYEFGAQASYYRQVRGLAEKEMPLELPPPAITTRGCSLVGHSGAGKSTAINRILSMYPQVIFHGRYKGRLFTHSQLVYVKLECPYDGLLSGLCKTFFMEVDRLLHTNTYERNVRRGQPKIDDLLLRMAGVASRHSIGVLVIDEIQNLRKAKGDGASDVLDFLLWLDNQLGIPVVLVGTPKALPVLTGEFRRARRAAGQEAIAWNRMREGEKDWELFTETLWNYQFVRTNSLLTPELRHVLYYESQGITDIAVKVYMLAQIEAITNRTEVLTEAGLISASHNRLSFVQPFLENLRRGISPEKIQEPEDLTTLDLRQIVEVELERIRESEIILSRNEEQKLESVGVQAPSPKQPATPAQLLSTPQINHSHQPEDVAKARISLVQALDSGKHQRITPYRTLKTHGYIRSALEYHETAREASSIPEQLLSEGDSPQ